MNVLRAHMICLATVFLLLGSSLCQGQASVDGYPPGVEDVTYPSAADGTQQPALFWKPETDKAAPLLVALHTWSSDYRQGGGETEYARWCQQAGWVFIHPNFRGSNTQPDALGSELVFADIKSAVVFAQEQANIDAERIYCVGVSGGGHASLLMAARAPELWAGVSAWCGISDITAWHEQCDQTKFQRYARHIEQALGGRPDSEARRAEALRRSPIHWLAGCENLPVLDINHGINDGRAGSVPFTHSLLAWNECVSNELAFPTDAISAFYETQSVPESLQSRNVATEDPLYGKNAPLFRVASVRTRLTIFNGGHEIVHHAALNWLAAQRRGQPANWNPNAVIGFDSENQESGK